MSYIFKVVDVEDPSTVLAEYDNGKDAGQDAKTYNEDRRAEGSDLRVRVLREKVETERTRLAYFGVMSGCERPGPAILNSDDDDLDAPGDFYDIPEDGADWRQREREKGIQKAAVWTAERWYRESEFAALHYPRVSDEDPKKIVHTPEESWGHEDRQLRMRPGAYLSRYFSDVLTDEDVQAWTLAHDKKYAPRELKLATTPDEIERVYRDGPRSCMSGGYRGDAPFPPVRVYGAGDLAVAYIEDADGEPTARCVVWPEYKIRTRLYGDSRLRAALDAEGYTHGSLDGARLLREELHPGVFVCPYLDDVGSVTDEGDYLRIDSCGELDGCNTEGTTGAVHYCECCDDAVMYREDMVSVQAGRHTELWCQYCADCNAAECVECYEILDLNMTHSTPDGESVCEDCFCEYYVDCEDCGEFIHREDARDFRHPEDYPATLCEECCEDAEKRLAEEIREREELAERISVPLSYLRVEYNGPPLARQDSLPLASVRNGEIHWHNGTDLLPGREVARVERALMGREDGPGWAGPVSLRAS